MGTQRAIAVIGAGLMGHGIALTFARAGHQVTLTDPDADVLSSAPERMATSLRALGATATEAEGAVAKVHQASSLKEAVANADVVFEAAPEKLALKKHIFSETEAHAPTHAILASNTSVIPITKITEHLETRHRALGTHWWNPPHLIPLVEVIKTQWTDPRLADDVMLLLAEVGKTPAMVEKDVPGFIGNRLQHALWREAISLVEKGICDAETVDTVIKSSFGRRLAVLGPLENADLVGTDLTLDIHENVLFDLESSRAPSPYLKKLVADGRLGMKSGQGFRTWLPHEADETRSRVGSHLKELEQLLTK